MGGGRILVLLALVMFEGAERVRGFGSSVLLANPRSLVPMASRSARRGSASVALSGLTMKDWSKRQTLAEKAGGVDDKGFDGVGLTGDIPVVFEQTVKAPKAEAPALWRRVIRRPPLSAEAAAYYSSQPRWRRLLRRPAPGTTIPEAAPEVAEGSEKTNYLKTMALQGQPLSAVAAQAGQYIKYKCKVGECGTCEVRINGNWVRTCVAKVPPVPKGEEYNVFVRGGMIETKKSTAFFSFSSFISGFRNNLLGMVGFVKEGIKGKKNFQDRISKEEELLAMVGRSLLMPTDMKFHPTRANTLRPIHTPLHCHNHHVHLRLHHKYRRCHHQCNRQFSPAPTRPCLFFVLCDSALGNHQPPFAPIPSTFGMAWHHRTCMR